MKAGNHWNQPGVHGLSDQCSIAGPCARPLDSHHAEIWYILDVQILLNASVIHLAMPQYVLSVFVGENIPVIV